MTLPSRCSVLSRRQMAGHFWKHMRLKDTVADLAPAAFAGLGDATRVDQTTHAQNEMKDSQLKAKRERQDSCSGLSHI
eukprot:7263020-Pyramimonas_sp.AAC.1